MNLKFSLILWLFSSISLANEISWTDPEYLDGATIFSCPQIAQYINSFEVRKGNNFQVWEFDINNDSTMDYLILAGVWGCCGSAGCTANLFLNNGTTCKSINSPYLYFDQKVGFNGSNLFLPNKKCGIWALKDSKLVHVENKDSCE